MLFLVLKIGMIFVIFNLVGYVLDKIERFINFVSILLIIFDEYFNSWVGYEYKLWDLLFGMCKIFNFILVGVIKLKVNDEMGELVLFIKLK